MTKKIAIWMLLLSFPAAALRAQSFNLPAQHDRWEILSDGSIEWKVAGRLPHDDHIEMSGEKVSLWVQYGVDADGSPQLSRTIVFPTFRLEPNKTHSSMMYTVAEADMPRFFVNDRLLKAGIYNGTPLPDMRERVLAIRHDGVMEVYSEIGKDGSLKLKRSLFPSVDKPMALERFLFTNSGQQPVTIEMEYGRKEVRPAAERDIDGPLRFLVASIHDGLYTVAPGDSLAFAVCFEALRGDEKPDKVDAAAEEQARLQRVAAIGSQLQLETPDTLLNTAFAFAKRRATESIYLTRGGFMHSPGGLRYYAAIWANDQAEYVNPFFAFLGDDIASKSAMNAYRFFARYMNPDYKPIPSSIVAEGEGTWHGKGDRGDMAMIAYGASRYALASGHPDSARVLWPLIEWCLEYLRRQVNANGVVHSNSDELEGRFPSGDANLHTSDLYYDALRSAAMLGKALGKPAAQTRRYLDEAKTLRKHIEGFFGATVEGYPTYRYYEGDTLLRAWICSPLTVGIYDRKDGTIDALFSPRLWTPDGLATQAGDKTFWDRATLYALRGVLAAGETTRAMAFLKYYSRRRLLGEHVPYPVEAYPEGNQRHLAAESGLYCRIYTEGLFGIRPTGLDGFDCTPRLPRGWDHMALRNVHAFGTAFDLEVADAGSGKLLITVKYNGKEKTYRVKENGTAHVLLRL